MITTFIRRVLLALVVAITAGGSWSPLAAREVAIEHLGIDLLGELEIPDGKTLERDGVALILHGTLAHHRMEIVRALQANLKAHGIATLAVTLSLGHNRRTGMLDCGVDHDHRHSDAVEELGAWVAWLRGEGAQRITLVGHSRGAAQVALYLAETTSDPVAAAVLIAPPVADPAVQARDYETRFGVPLAEVQARAQAFADDDEGDKLMVDVGFLSCPKARVTASAFLDYAKAGASFDPLGLVSGLDIPVLVIAAGNDEVVPGLLPRLKGATLRPGLESVVVDGADHFFRDLANEDAADRIRDFLAKVR